MDKIRLSKLMAERGLCSRREADTFIEKGLVLVNGERVNTLGIKVLSDVQITLDKQAMRRQRERVTILVNKPMGLVSAQPEKGYAAAISLVTPANRDQNDHSRRRFHPSQLRGLAPAGRLDIDSRGLLVLTQDGRVARRLVGENSDVEKEYLVRVTGGITAKILQRLCHGLQLDDRPLKPAKVTRLNQEQLKFVLKEGRKRQIRHMCEQVGLRVTGLKRVRIGRVRLGSLPEGKWRYLRDDETF